MIIWKDFILDPVMGALLSDDIFEGESHGLSIMDEGSVANQETRQTQMPARMVSREGLSLKTAAKGKDAPAIALTSLRDTGRRGEAHELSCSSSAVEK